MTTTPLGLTAGMAADYRAYLDEHPAQRKAPAMPTLPELTREAADLRLHDDDAVVCVTYMVGRWQIDVHVTVLEALPHCTRRDDDGEPFGLISVTADTFDQALTQAMYLVRDAVAATPCPNIP